MANINRESIPYRVLTLLHDSEAHLGSGVIARKLGIDRHIVQKCIPKLVRRGVLTRERSGSYSYHRYFCTPEQYRKYLGRDHEDLPDGGEVVTVERKLKFLTTVAQGVHHDNPVLAEIVADYQRLCTFVRAGFDSQVDAIAR
ncbi:MULTISPECIES: helix-turn-helix domain-containing protein [Pandoraea]|uniref:MarR family transcriptional regulator n=1 Tax=Pandoraea TaxID=93217 RepID=UPI001F5DCCC5|nr:MULTISPECIES: helix-turn-helix domain-containing protein [Pandoraea]MCI3206547.1 hypothetical protein [Pandoraea sp. LA3]MDN4584575.1 hypothetical protein [Pandoraea capi]